jgi:hypothetical protein
VRPPSHRVSEDVRAQITEILEGWGLSSGEESR